MYVSDEASISIYTFSYAALSCSLSLTILLGKIHGETLANANKLKTMITIVISIYFYVATKINKCA